MACLSNPVKSDLGICLTLQQASRVKLTVYSITGQLVDILADRNFNAGVHELHWNTDGLATGVYMISAVIPQVKVSEKIVVLK